MDEGRPFRGAWLARDRLRPRGPGRLWRARARRLDAPPRRRPGPRPPPVGSAVPRRDRRLGHLSPARVALRRRLLARGVGILRLAIVGEAVAAAPRDVLDRVGEMRL